MVSVRSIDRTRKALYISRNQFPDEAKGNILEIIIIIDNERFYNNASSLEEATEICSIQNKIYSDLSVVFSPKPFKVCFGKVKGFIKEWESGDGASVWFSPPNAIV